MAGLFKKSKTVTGKYASLRFTDEGLVSFDKKTGLTMDCDLLKELEEIYGEDEFSVSTKSSADEEIEIDEELILE